MPTENRVTRVTTSQGQPDREQRIFSFKMAQWIWLLLGILEAIIALRIGLLLVGANPNSLIVSAIYSFTSLFLFPFNGVIRSPSAGNMVLELSSIFAMLIYALMAWAAERIIWLIFYRPAGSAVDTSETTTSDHFTNP